MLVKDGRQLLMVFLNLVQLADVHAGEKLLQGGQICFRGIQAVFEAHVQQAQPALLGLHFRLKAQLACLQLGLHAALFNIDAILVFHLLGGQVIKVDL